MADPGAKQVSVSSSEVVSLWGANGCGNPTFFRAVTDKVRVFAGSLERLPGLPLGLESQQPTRRR